MSSDFTDNDFTDNDFTDNDLPGNDLPGNDLANNDLADNKMANNVLALAERHLLDRAARWPEHGRLSELTSEVLGNVSQRQGAEFATAVLYDRIIRSAEHGPLVERIQNLQRHLPTASRPIDATVVFVPGAFYVEHPETGADAAQLRDQVLKLGCPTELIPILSIGTVAENGRIIRDWLCDQTAGNIILVSLSKGSADVKMALSTPDAQHAFRNVVAWINLSGILGGSPMVAWMRSRRWARLFCRLLFWIRGRDYRFVRDLDRCSGSLLDFQLRPPEHLRLIHVAGFALPQHASCHRARRWHRRLSPWGPTDSVMLLADLVGLPGHLLPVWGTDHYLQSGSNAETLLRALLHYLGEELDLQQPLATTGMVTQ